MQFLIGQGEFQSWFGGFLGWLRLGGQKWCLKAHIWHYEGYDIPNISKMLKINLNHLSRNHNDSGGGFLLVFDDQPVINDQQKPPSWRWKDRPDAKAGKYHVWYGFAVGIFTQDREAHWLWHLSGNRTYDNNWSWKKGVALYALFRPTFWVGQIKLGWWFERTISLHSGSFLENDMWHHQPATDLSFITSWNCFSFFSFFFPALFCGVLLE